MSFSLQPDETLSTSVRRIAAEQVDAAVLSLRTHEGRRDEAIHDARKRMKKVRAVLRLVRPVLGADLFDRENSGYRDAARCLSDVRDAFVFVQALDRLAARFPGDLPQRLLSPVRERLEDRLRDRGRKILLEQGAMSHVISRLREARGRIEDWPLPESDDFGLVRGGLEKVYRRGRKRMREVSGDPRPEGFHDWRKRVKYLWYHVRILEPVWPGVLGGLVTSLHDLSDDLGSANDLTRLSLTLIEEHGLIPDDEDFDLLQGAVARRRVELWEKARTSGERIYRSSPKAFVNQVGDYFRLWREEHPIPVRA